MSTSDDPPRAVLPWPQDDPAAVRDRLRDWAREHASPDVTVDAVERLPGHSGITYGFDLHARAGRDRLVLRVPPLGVRRQGNTDLLRQVPVLRALTAHAVPVPRVRWSGADPRWFGTPYLVVDRLAGGTLGDVLVDREVPPDRPTGRRDLFGQAVDALAAVHAVDVPAHLAGWDDPRPLPGLVDRWLRLLGRWADPATARVGAAAARQLLERLPRSPGPAGLVHGDFYSNNWLYDGARLTAVLDWEAAHTGPVAIDVGWLCMMYDPSSWDPARRPDLAVSPTPEFLLERYEAAAGVSVVDPDWFRALAGLRLAALTAYYRGLHRSGQRPDPAWEWIGGSLPAMLDRAVELSAAPVARRSLDGRATKQ